MSGAYEFILTAENVEGDSTIFDLEASYSLEKVSLKGYLANFIARLRECKQPRWTGHQILVCTGEAFHS